MSTTPRVVVAGTLPAAGLDLLRARFVVDAGGEEANGDWLLEHAPGAASIVANPAVRVDDRLLDSAGHALRVVANFGVGFDNIDLEAVRRRGVRATNTPGVVTNATAELAVALMLAAGRRIAAGDAIVRRGDWSVLGSDDLLGRELAGATVD